MRHMTLVITFLLLGAALAAGCTSTETNAAMSPQPPDAKASVAATPSQVAAVQLGEAKAETKEAAQAMQEYAYAKKIEFVANMKNELNAIQKEMDRIALKIDRADVKVKADANTKLAALRAKWVETKLRLDLAEAANESNWEDVKAGFRQSQADLVAHRR